MIRFEFDAGQSYFIQAITPHIVILEPFLVLSVSILAAACPSLTSDWNTEFRHNV